jgi:hypothetical protein
MASLFGGTVKGEVLVDDSWLILAGVCLLVYSLLAVAEELGKLHMCMEYSIPRHAGYGS